MARQGMSIFVDDRALVMFERDLAGLSRDFGGTNHMRAPLQESAKNIAQSIDKNFQVGGRPVRWKPVQFPSQYRDTAGGGHGPLWVTGKMKNAAKAMARFKIKNNVMTYGYFPPTVWYAALHDAGTGGMPQRPFALLQRDDVDDVVRSFMRWVERMVNRHIRLRYP